LRSVLLNLLTGPTTPKLADVARAFVYECDADGVVIFLSDGEELRVGAAIPSLPETEAQLRVPLGRGVTGLVARNGHAVRLGSDRPRSAAYRELLGLGDDDTVARMCLPARGMNGQIVGVLAAHRATDRPFTDPEVTRLQSLADLLGLRLHAQRLMDAVDEHRSVRDRLIAQAISAQETERRRIAFDLHDGVTTALASMSFHLNAAELSLSAHAHGRELSGDLGQAQAQIGSARRLADLAYNQTRAAITGLHSLVLDDHGLVAAIESLAQTVPEVTVEFLADDSSVFADVPDHAAAALFRIAQETLRNAVKHAKARQVVLSLRRVDDAVILGTADDGVGFDLRAQLEARSDDREDSSQAGHFGLSSIAERAALIGASLRIETEPGSGTTVLVELPLPGADSAMRR
jgi:two-component system NarL family sensor kinase